jgi:hypothetical protein
MQFHRQVEFQSRPAVGISRHPRFSKIERTIARPRPIPFDLVVKKALKMRGITSGSMPFPGAEPRCGCAPLPNRTMFPPSPPGIKIQETRIIIRFLEVLLNGGNNLGGWSARHIHQVILESFQLTEKAYALNQLRYDLRKLKGHGLLECDGSP